MKKAFLILLTFSFSTLQALACDVCKRNQPELLQDISHGTGPQSNAEYYIIGGAILIVLFTLFYSLKFLIKPGERSPEHIKKLILKPYPEI